MPISSTDFITWLDTNNLPTTPSALSRISTVSRETLSSQIRRGITAEASVVSIARGVHMDPVLALAAFDPYHDILTRSFRPSEGEVLSQVHSFDLIAELLQREVPENDVRTLTTAPLLSPLGNSQRSWIKAIDDGSVRAKIAAATGRAPSYLSKQISTNKLTPTEVVAASRAAGGSLISGLVVIGLITEEEGHWGADARKKALRSAETLTLIDWLQYQLKYLRRSI